MPLLALKLSEEVYLYFLDFFKAVMFWSLLMLFGLLVPQSRRPTCSGLSSYNAGPVNVTRRRYNRLNLDL